MQQLDKGGLPTLFNKNKNVEDATDDLESLDARLNCLALFEVNNDECYKLYFESKDEDRRTNCFTNLRLRW